MNDGEDGRILLDVRGKRVWTGLCADVDAAHSAETEACVVADTFAAYRDIRGAIVQGAVMWPPASDDVAMLTVSRTVTFSFVNA